MSARYSRLRVWTESYKPGSHEQTAETVDAWVAAFQDKVRQIEARHCRPAS
jgi:hypothetical protein